MLSEVSALPNPSSCAECTPEQAYKWSGGTAIYATQAKRVSDEMFIEAAKAVADQVTPELLAQGLLYPLQANILETEIKTAARVAKLVFDSGLAGIERPADMEALIRQHVYTPTYQKLV